ncbi:hypothetical protein L593_14555 [Salinarchaeum sp. Harcht-Bsk1]|uniref:hypothetical protein n=1 Tax=Salinarchaeum sp. Harcht-Bsk1 TaxID=1333523 RepID=UPI0003422D7D|nr:hypothetical protein [Salinarchaeum sp. Harcht-Bsk1]AGN02850.1 hypothetical protein L593_14555 [Salinarchaeum sp. Harcht-Bsk1]
MRVPVPKNKLVAFTLIGALLTAGVAGALALPGGGLAQAGEQPDSPGSTASEASQQAASDAPTPNQDFTPAVQTQSGYEEEEHEEYEEDDEEEYEEEHEDEEHEEDE